MKTSKEVCNIVGITRKTLRGYDEIGLLHPTAKTENGYWLYDDNAIHKLIFIQMFAVAGYERKQIKRLLDSDDLDIMAEFDNVISLLKEKRNRIDGMINAIEAIKSVTKLPPSAIKALSKMNYIEMCQQRSFSEQWEEMVTHSSNLSEEEISEVKVYMPFWYQLMAIGCLHGKDLSSDEVCLCIEDFLADVIKSDIFGFKDDEEFASWTEAVQKVAIAFSMIEAVQEMVAEPEVSRYIELQFGPETVNFIISAMKKYVDDHEYVIEEYDLEEGENG